MNIEHTYLNYNLVDNLLAEKEYNEINFSVKKCKKYIVKYLFITNKSETNIHIVNLFKN